MDSNCLCLGAKLFFKVSSQLPETNEQKSGYDHTFLAVSKEAFPDAVGLRIDWISWNSKTVLLMSNRYEADLEEVYVRLKAVCGRSEFEKVFYDLTELPDHWTPSTKGFANHPIGVILSIVRRLNFVDMLLSLGLKDTHMYPAGPAAWALFILCTCIDSLGQRKPYLDYGDWLKAQETINEVKGAISSTRTNSSSQEFLVSIFDYYKSLYGSRRAFHNFFETRLSQNMREELTSTIEVCRNRPGDFELSISSTLDELVDFLEEFRNSYAHDFESHYNVLTSKQLADLRGKEESIRTFAYQRVFPSGAFETIITSITLPETLAKAVRFALWSWMLDKRHASIRS